MVKKVMSKKSMAMKSLAKLKSERNRNSKINKRKEIGKHKGNGRKKLPVKKEHHKGKKVGSGKVKESNLEEQVSGSSIGSGIEDEDEDDVGVEVGNVDRSKIASVDEVKDDKNDKSKETNQAKKKREKKKFDFERNSRTIFVGNLPCNLDHKDVANMFKCCGPIESARIRSIVPEKEKLSQKVAGITKRFHAKVDSVNAYVVFESNEDDTCVKKALKMNGSLKDGHHIRVDRAKKPNSKKQTLTSRKKSVFVGNLRFDIRDDDLINHFKKVGPVAYVRIVRDKGVGMGKGFGFVEFEDRASAKKALELNDSQFKGRALRVKKVDDKVGTKK